MPEVAEVEFRGRKQIKEARGIGDEATRTASS